MMMEWMPIETSDGERIMVDCGACKGCGEADASGFACPTCGGRGFFVYKQPKRDYEAAGRRAFLAGKSSMACPYRYGWAAHGWILGWMDEAGKKKPSE
jgi:ribosome modulation factor